MQDQDSTTTTDRDTYNGWASYETWLVCLWLDNDEGSYEWVRELARDSWNNASETTYATRGEVASWALAEHLSDHHDENVPWGDDAPVSVFSDLMGAALSRVDWHELGHHYVTEVLFESMGAA